MPLILSSCLKDDYNLKDTSLQYSPEIATPLLKTSVVASDFLSTVDSNLLSENGDKLLEFVYTDLLHSLSISEIIEIPNENINFTFQLDPLHIQDLPESISVLTLDTVVNRVGEPFQTLFNGVNGTCTSAFPSFSSQSIGEVNISMTNGAFQTATFSNGILKVEIENKWPNEINNVELSLKRVSDGVSVDTLRYLSILPGATLADSIDMKGKSIEVDMIGDFINLSSPGTINPECINGNDSIILKVSGYDFVVDSGTAILSNQEVINDTSSFGLALGFGEQLETLILNSGDLDLSINYQIKEEAILYIELPFATKNSIPFIDSIILSAGPSIVNASFDLTNYSFDLTRLGQGFNSIETIIRANIKSSGLAVSFDTSSSVTVDLAIININPQFIDGYFGNRNIVLDADTQSFETGTSDLFESMSFSNPILTLGFHNTFGVPIDISSLNLTMKKGNNEEDLNPGELLPFNIQNSHIAAPDEAVTSNLILDNQTNITQLINLWPNEVITSFTGSINTSGSSYNYALDTSKIDVTLDLSIPLYGTIDELNITDTIDIDSSMNNLFQNVEKASLRTNVENGFPLEAKVKFYVTDENYLILDSLESIDGNDVLINAAIVDGSGDVTTSASMQSDLLADEDVIALLKMEGNKFLLSVTLNTANSGADVKIYSNYSMDIKIGLLAMLSFEIDLGSISSDEE